MSAKIYIIVVRGNPDKYVYMPLLSLFSAVGDMQDATHYPRREQAANVRQSLIGLGMSPGLLMVGIDPVAARRNWITS